jgi:hypothetical protein
MTKLSMRWRHSIISLELSTEITSAMYHSEELSSMFELFLPTIFSRLQDIMQPVVWSVLLPGPEFSVTCAPNHKILVMCETMEDVDMWWGGALRWN